MFSGPVYITTGPTEAADKIRFKVGQNTAGDFCLCSRLSRDIFIICAFNIYIVDVPRWADECVHIRYHTVDYCKLNCDCTEF